MADVFISYHETSAGGIVRQIAAALENVGVSCWYAGRNLLPGSFAGAITREIRSCKVFLLVLNEESNQSEHVQNEVGIAFRRISDHESMMFLPFKLDDCVLSDDMYYYLNRFQIIDGNPLDKAHIIKLVGQISRFLEIPIDFAIAKSSQTLRVIDENILLIMRQRAAVRQQNAQLIRYEEKWTQSEEERVQFESKRKELEEAEKRLEIIISEYKKIRKKILVNSLNLSET